ncbi:MAG: RidA family protein [Burkholderiaceae bacterium]
MTTSPEARLKELGLTLPAPTRVPADIHLPFAFVHVVGRRVLISGHGPTDADGHLCGPFGKVGLDLSVEQAVDSARATALSILADLRDVLGSLDRIAQWVRVFGMVNAAKGFNGLPQVINGCSVLLLDVFGEQVGRHARSAVGMAELPWNIPVEIEGELLLRD